MSSLKKSSVAKIRSILGRYERKMAKKLSIHRQDEILATGMDLSPGIRIPDQHKQPHEKICHIIYHHFKISGDTKLGADSRRDALSVTRKVLKIVKAAVREEENQNATVVTNTTKDTPSQRTIADQAANASGKENLLEEAKDPPPQVAPTKNGTTASSRPQVTHPSSPQIQRNSSRALAQQQHKLQRNSFSLSNYCQANDAYKETNPSGVNNPNTGNKVPPPFRKPPPYQEKSPLLGGGKEAQKRRTHSSKRADKPPNHDEAHQKRVAEDQKRLKAKQLEEQRRRDEAKKREGERLSNQRERKRIEEQKKREKEQEEERIRLEEEKREAERKRVEEQRRKKEEERKRLEETKRKKEEAEQRRKEQERRKKEAERKKEEEKRKKIEKEKRQEELRKEKERQRAAELMREKKESEISAVMQAAEAPRNTEMGVVFPADNVKPFRNNGLHPRPETVIRLMPHRMNKTQALDMATRLLRWDPYWTVCKYVKCGMTTAGDDVSGGEKKFGASFSFSISGSDIREMRNSDWGVVSIGDYQDSQMRLILRMIPVTSSDKNRADLHLWPKGTYLYLNGKALSPSQRKQQEHLHTKWQGLCKPLDLTEHIQRPTDRNEIKILTVEGAPYYFCVALCKYMSPAKLMKLYLNSEPGVFFASSFAKLNLEQSKAKAKTFTQQATLTLDDSDEEEAPQPDASSGKFVFTLTCPFSKTILKHPVRGRQCKHYQCFDLSNFLTSNRTVRGNQWRCMVCEQFVSFYDLSLDSLVGDLAYEFRNELVPTDRDRIEYRADETYTLLGTKKPRYNNKKRPLPDVSSSSNVAPKKKAAAPANAEPEIILLDDDDD